ncbi:hypothetical protein RJ639_046337 [Escallonia herrerae]|uniref:FAS1 domain-containing protein n=1 Tax=Escallonia herrerae TaxID=1293975 RepID=A0AA88W9A7_9ASTE|nr:hypothetical protein RJ639_046337 [Escallonia herrerae]
MHLSPALPLSLLLSLLLLFLTTTNAHNITRILAKHPEFSTFNHYLTITHLAAEINRRQTITVCAVDNAAMSALLSKGLTVYSIKNVLSLHVFADYFGAKKLHQITKGSTLTATMFQATGEAAGTSGYVNITDLKGGRVSFSAEDSDGSLSAVYVKSLLEMPYNISVIQISHILSSPEAEAPASAPTGKNVTGLMSQKGCKAFADLLISSGADVTFIQNSDGGLTVFCPTDTVVTAFMPKYKNLTAAGKASLLLYHGVPVYQSMGMLRSNNGLMNTLATEGPNKYDFTIQNDGEDVKLDTKAATAKIVATLIDAEPLAIYKIDKVLLPRELFKPAPSPHAPKGEAAAEAPGPASDDEDPADQTASDSNGVVRIGGGRSVVSLVLGFCIGGVLAFV